MKEYIEREALLKEEQEVYHWNGTNDIYGNFISSEIVRTFPAADVAPVVHGEWIPIVNHFHGKPDGRYYCSECYRVETIKSIYCRLCGARMDGGNE